MKKLGEYLRERRFWMKQQQRSKTAYPGGTKGVRKESEGMKAGVRDVSDSHKKQTETINQKGDQKMEQKTVFAGFDMRTISEDVVKLMKFSLDTTFDSVHKIQDYNTKIMKDMIEMNKKVQADAEKIVNEFIDNGKKGVDEYKKVVAGGLKKVEELIQPVK